MNRKNVMKGSIISAVAMTAVFAFTAVAFAATTNVTSAGLNGWTTYTTGTGTVNFVADASTTNGAADLNTPDDSAVAGLDLAVATTSIASVTDMTYTSKRISGAVHAAPAYVVGIDTNNTGSADFYAWYEPVYNGGSNYDTYQLHTLDNSTTQFWSFSAVGTSTTKGGANGSNFFTLNDVAATYPNAKIVEVSLNQGSGNGTWETRVDSASFNGTLYDFGQAPAPTSVFVNADNTCAGQTPCYTTIQAAVDAVASGGTVTVAAGTYPESVLIGKPLTLAGAGASSTPTTITGSASNTDYVIKVTGTTGVVIQNLAVASTGAAATNGIDISGSTANVHDVLISSFGKRGIRFTTSTGSIYNSEIIGDNVDGTSRVQNLVNVWTGSTVDVYNDVLRNALTTGTTPTWSSPAVLVTSFDGTGNGAASSAHIHDNQIYSDDTAVTVGSIFASGDASTATINNNTIHNVNTGISFESSAANATINENTFVSVPLGVTSQDSNATSTATVDVTKNYWGSASGPQTASSTGTGSMIDGNVSFSPWYTDFAKTTLQFTGVASSTGTATTTSSATDANGRTVSESIAPNTVITGDSNWDGTLEPVHFVTTQGVTPSSNSTVTSSVYSVEIGSTQSKLTLSRAAKLTFSGQAGKLIGWKAPGGSFTAITATCAANDQATGDALAAGADCKISVNGDLVVWTKHFTVFTVYTETAESVASGGGGGGGGGGGPIFIGNNAAAPVAGGSSVPSGSTGSTGSTGSVGGSTGSVLGAATFNFTSNLTIGSTGTQVIELQKFLIAQGFSIPSLTNGTATYGYFGVQTRAAVAAYQSAHGIKPSVGYFGPLTRAVVNATAPAMTAEQRAALIASLIVQLHALQAQLAAIIAANAAAGH